MYMCVCMYICTYVFLYREGNIPPAYMCTCVCTYVCMYNVQYYCS